MKSMILQKELKLINNSSKCVVGPVVTCRKVKGKMKMSCIDYLLVSQDLDRCLMDASMGDTFYCFRKARGFTVRLESLKVQQKLGLFLCPDCDAS